MIRQLAAALVMGLMLSTTAHAAKGDKSKGHDKSLPFGYVEEVYAGLKKADRTALKITTDASYDKLTADQKKAVTQKAHDQWTKLADDKKEAIRAAAKKKWDSLSPEEKKALSKNKKKGKKKKKNKDSDEE